MLQIEYDPLCNKDFWNGDYSLNVSVEFIV